MNKLPIFTVIEALSYNRSLGTLIWRERPTWHFKNDHVWRASQACKRWNSVHAGSRAFTQKTKTGYLSGVLDDQRLLAHRVAMAIHLGRWFEETVDHINGNRSDNRIDNLRLATRQQQSRNTSSIHNSTSKYLGVSYRKERGVWRANIFLNGKQVFLGSFKDEVEAAKAYDKAARENFKEFAKCNFV